MNAFTDALERAGIATSDFEDVEVDEEAIERDLEIEFLEQWLKLKERGASTKEQYLFATKHGFASEKHLNIYLNLTGEISDLEFEINENSEFLTPSQLKAKEEELKEKQAMVKTVKDPWCYRRIMRMLKVKDVSPYGLDVIRERPFAATKQERMRQVMMMDL